MGKKETMSRTTAINNPTTINPDGTNASLNISADQTVIDNTVGTEVKINGTTALDIKDAITMTAKDNNDIVLATSGTGKVVISNLSVGGMSTETLTLTHDGTDVDTGLPLSGVRSVSIFASAQGDGTAASNAAGQYSIVKRDDSAIVVNVINQFEGTASDVFEFTVDDGGFLNIRLTDSSSTYTSPSVSVKVAVYGF